jgi:hypothetical protein
MKTLFKLITLSAVAVVAYKAYEQSKKRKEEKEVNDTITIETPKFDLPKLESISKLDDALVQSYKVQTKVMMDSYPSNQMIDIVHTITFNDKEPLDKFCEYLKKSNIEYKINGDNLSINLTNTINTDVQEAFNTIIKVAEMTVENDGVYQGWVFENLK